MSFSNIRYAIFFIAIFFLIEVKGQNSVLQSGTWFKVSVDHDGVYKISADALKNMGFKVNDIDPRKIKIYGNGGGMLPQPNNIARHTDLFENAIFVQGEEDGKLDQQDFILFYGQGPDKRDFDFDNGVFTFQKNLYSDVNCYFVTVGETNGLRVTSTSTSGSGLPIINSFDDALYHETDQYNILTSGREWFGENFAFNTSQTFSLNLSNVVAGTSLKVLSNVMGRSTSGCTFNLFVNDVTIGSQTVASIANPVDSPYSRKGESTITTFTSLSEDVLAPSKQTQQLKYQYNKGTGDIAAYLNYFVVNCKRKLSLYGDQTIFSSKESTQNAKSQFQLSSIPDNSTIWDITTPLTPAVQSFTFSSGEASFNAESSTLHQYIIFNSNIPSPKMEGAIVNQNIHGHSTPNLIIVTNPLFRDEAVRLANHRERTGYETLVVTTTEVYNEFSSGNQDITGIRDLAKYFYDKDPSKLKALLLVGRASYDYKARVTNNTNLVPTYESRNSLDPLETYSSDDYFGFMEDSEGEWGEDPAIDHTLDISVGRLPVRTVDDIQNVVTKIIDYETGAKRFGNWRKNIVFVAEDGDNNTHQGQADKMAIAVETLHPEYNAKRIFVDDFPQIIRPGGTTSPETNTAIIDAFNRGAFIINYTGHGGETVWSNETIFDLTSIDKLVNKAYPLMITATCVFGRSDDPDRISGAERCLIKKNAGAIALVSTARPVSSSTNFELNKAFYDALFTKISDNPLTLGEIFALTKNNSVSEVSNRNFSLLGDPSMNLAFGEHQIAITEITNDNGTDTLKALSKVTMKGEVRNQNNSIVTSFNGTLNATLYDKKTSFTTLGTKSPAYTYKQWSNIIFRGDVSVKDGAFEFTFVVPKNIAYQIGQGKLSLYAKSSSGDAIGYDQDFVVGNSNPTPATDNTPPKLQAYMGDESFINGSNVSADCNLIVDLQDENGINISGYGIGNSIVGILDGNSNFILNDFYTADLDKYTSGRISYPLHNLTPGNHSLEVKAWDTHNNPGATTVRFTVSDAGIIQINGIGVYPNPADKGFTLYFTHNMAGDDLDGEVSFYNITGQVVKTFNFNIEESNFRVELPEIDTEKDFDKKLAGGLYLVRLSVRSISNGSKNERVTRLIILN